MTVTEYQQETGWGKRADTWVPPAPLQVHGHRTDDIDGIWDPGDIKWSARVKAAPGWLKCDWSLKSREAYPRLFDAIGFAYSPTPGADPGGGMFYVPPPGRMPVGLDPTQVEFDTLGKTGGSKTSTAPHTHALSAHTHSFGHTHGMNSVDTNHAHNVYTRNADTGWMNQNWSHWHGASIGNVYYMNHQDPHRHGGGCGYAAEAASPSTGGACAVPVNVNGTDTNHVHNFNHDHPSTNYQSESPWAGTYNHAHTTNSQSTSTSGAPSNDTSGASSAAATSGNLPPYVVFNCFIKT